MFERSGAGVLLGGTRGIIENRVTDVAVVADHLARIALVLTIVATETTGRNQVADVVWVSLPISLHFRKEVSLVDALDLFDRAVH